MHLRLTQAGDVDLVLVQDKGRAVLSIVEFFLDVELDTASVLQHLGAVLFSATPLNSETQF